jgi:glyoxylate reductase
LVINTAREPVIDEEAFVKALNEGKIRSCRLDVYEGEPEVHTGLATNSRVSLLPHVGRLPFETQKLMEPFIIANFKRAVVEGKLLGLVPGQARVNWD